MKRFVCISVIMLISSLFVLGQTAVNVDEALSDIAELRSNCASMQTYISTMQREMLVITAQNKHLVCKIDSLNNQIRTLRDSVYLLNSQVKDEIIQANNTISTSQTQLSSSIRSKSLIGILVIVLLALVGYIVSSLLRKKVKGAYMVN